MLYCRIQQDLFIFYSTQIYGTKYGKRTVLYTDPKTTEIAVYSKNVVSLKRDSNFENKLIHYDIFCSSSTPPIFDVII
jgi:hypothetical protein